MRTTVAVAAASALLLSGCATVLHGNSQNVQFNSTPDGALVTMDGVAVGRTPVVVPVDRRSKAYDVAFELVGFHDYVVELDAALAAVYWGNLVAGGLIGAAVDLVGGSAWKFEEAVYAELVPSHLPNPQVAQAAEEAERRAAVTPKPYPRPR